VREEFERYVGEHNYPYEWEDMHEVERWKEDNDPLIQMNKRMAEKYGYDYHPR